MTERDRPSRRTVLHAVTGVTATIGASSAAGARSGTDATSDRGRRARSTDGPERPTFRENPNDADQYVATVDRVVDGEHVVILLEADCETVDQLVVSKDEHEDLEERDVLIVVVADDELLAYWHIPEKPPCDEARS